MLESNFNELMAQIAQLEAKNCELVQIVQSQQ